VYNNNIGVLTFFMSFLGKITMFQKEFSGLRSASGLNLPLLETSDVRGRCTAAFHGILGHV
jgi:hypothetical protein